MLKVSQNQIDFQTAANLYQRGLATLKTALGRRPDEENEPWTS